MPFQYMGIDIHDYAVIREDGLNTVIGFCKYKELHSERLTIEGKRIKVAALKLYDNCDITDEIHEFVKNIKNNENEFIEFDYESDSKWDYDHDEFELTSAYLYHYKKGDNHIETDEEYDARMISEYRRYLIDMERTNKELKKDKQEQEKQHIKESSEYGLYLRLKDKFKDI